VESPQVGQVIPARQPPPFQVDYPRGRQRGLCPGKLTGVGDAQPVAQHAARRVKVRIRPGRSAHPR